MVLFQRVQQGDEELAITETIIAEVTDVLISHSRLDHGEIAARVRPLLASSGLELTHQRVVQHAMERDATSLRLDFEDAVKVEHLARRGIPEIVSDDRDGVD